MSEQTVILAKICAIYDKPKFVLKKNNHFMKLFKCVDLEDYYNNNSKFLTPYVINQVGLKIYENPSGFYDVFTGLDNIFTELLLDNNVNGIADILIELGGNIPIRYFVNSDEEDLDRMCLEQLKGLYQLVGLELIEKEDGFFVKPFSGDKFKLFDLNMVEKWLLETFDGVLDSYEGATDAFTSGHYGTCIEASRTVLTGIFSKYKGPETFAKWFRGVANLTGEYQENPTQLKKELESNG